MTDHTLEQAQKLKNRILRLEAMQKLTFRDPFGAYGHTLIKIIEASDEEISRTLYNLVDAHISVMLSAAEAEFEALI